MSVHDKISRREMLKRLGAATAGVAATALLPGQALTARAARASTRLVIMTTFDANKSADLIKAIETAHPGVTVDWRNLTDERYVELFSAADLANEQIDIMDLNGQDLRRYATAGRMLDLTSSVKYADRFRDISTATYRIDGKQWAVPRGGISGFSFLYNKKLLDKVGMTSEPTTYDDLVKLAPELKKVGASVFTHQGKNVYLWPVWQFWAFAQTSGNQPVEKTIKSLQGEMKFTDPEHVAALEIVYRFGQDKLFIDNVLGLDNDTEATFFQGKAAFWYWGTWEIGNYRAAKSPKDGSKDKVPDLEMSIMPPVLAVKDSKIRRQNPGGVGSATGIYAKIAPERKELALSVVDLMTSDPWVKWWNATQADPVSSNRNVTASDDPIALKYAKESSPNQFTYLDWLYPPELTKAFQEQLQALVAGSTQPDAAAKAIQKTFDGIVADGYQFGK